MPPHIPQIHFTLLRHGDAYFCQDREYSTLTQLGKAQVRQQAQHLSKIHFDLSISSPAMRALQTASLVLQDSRAYRSICPDLQVTRHGSFGVSQRDSGQGCAGYAWDFDDTAMHRQNVQACVEAIWRIITKYDGLFVLITGHGNLLSDLAMELVPAYLDCFSGHVLAPGDCFIFTTNTLEPPELWMSSGKCIRAPMLSF